MTRLQALLSYDYLLTLDGEITKFWRSDNTFAKWLFFLNRYCAFVYLITRILMDVILTTSTTVRRLHLLYLRFADDDQ